MPDSRDFAVVGRVRRAHGIRGELVVEPFTDVPAAIFAAGRRVFAGSAEGVPLPAAPELHVERASPFKGGLIVAFREIADRTAAERWRDRTMLLPFEELEPPAEGEIFVHDLPGMRLELRDGTVVGTIETVWELPQGFVLEVRRAQGTVMVPYNDQVVVALDPEARVVVVEPPEGLLE